jgi:hypothetical protein
MDRIFDTGLVTRERVLRSDGTGENSVPTAEVFKVLCPTVAGNGPAPPE